MDNTPLNKNTKPISKDEMAKLIAANMVRNLEDKEPEVIRSNDETAVNRTPVNQTGANINRNTTDSSVAVKEKVRKEDMAVNTTKKKPATASGSAKKSNGSKKKKKKKNKAKKIALLTCLVAVMAVLAAGATFYALGKSKYDGKFLANTSINGIDVSGLTEEEVIEQIRNEELLPTEIVLQKIDGTEATINFDEVGYTENISSTVDEYYSEQNHAVWFKSLFGKTEYAFTPSTSYDKTKLNAVVKRKVIEGQTATEAQDAYVDKTDDGYVVVPEVFGNKIDDDQIDKLYAFIDDAINDGVYNIDLSTADCYQKPSVVAADLQEDCDKLNNINSIEITFDFVWTTEVLKGNRIIDWIDFNDDGTYTVDQTEVVNYVTEIGNKYNTYRVDRTFKSTNRGTITVEGGEGIYGWWLDDDQMAALITSLIEEGSSADATPIFYTNPYSKIEYVGNEDCWTENDDIGNTYLELDLSAQHMWYYKDGKMIWETDVVTGMPTETRNTPEGVYKVWFQAKNFRLKDSNADGSSWDTVVAYWNNISNCGIGIHDATWQPYFGGTLYKTNGSHGCINVSLTAAQYVYENVDLNTPVVAYWSDD